MQYRPYILSETNWFEVKRSGFKTAVLPWGATEAHNYHLPYGTDNIQLDHISAEAARKASKQNAQIVVLPTIPFGVNTGQLDIQLDINLMPSTQAAILRDIAECLCQQGIERLLILNGHGGNDFKQIVREVGSRVPGLFLCTANWFKCMDMNAYFDEPGDHAGELETSLLMYFAPELVRPLFGAGSGEARSFGIEGLRSGWVWAERPWSKVTADTGVGDPAQATAEKGRRFFEALTDKLAKFLVDLDTCDSDDLLR